MKNFASFVFVAFFVLTGCSGGVFADKRLDTALQIGHQAFLFPLWIKTEKFSLLAQSKFSQPNKSLHLYIEGDGFAYVTRSRPSFDPTPHKPLALTLATLDPHPNVAWLARPCQYAMLAKEQASCPQKYWTSHRMAPEVISSLDQAITILTKNTGATQIEIIGYSGGGAVAALLAARRQDVVSLRTVAGNLDNAAFIRHHEISPMPESLDAKDITSQICAIPQLHFMGSEDSIVPPFLSNNFIKQVGASAQKIIIPEVTHETGWSATWPRLLQTPLPDAKLSEKGSNFK